MTACAAAFRVIAPSRRWAGRLFACSTAVLLPLPPLAAQEQMPDGSVRYVVGTPGSGRFPLAAGGQVAALHLDQGEWPGVIRAANDLKLDLGKVTGVEPAVSVGGQAAGAAPLVLIGTIGKSATIDRLVAEGKA